MRVLSTPMVIYNAATRELTAKIVYYGPGLGGKTTNLQVLHDRLEPSTVGKLLNLSTQTDRTIYFDLLPVELGDIKGYKIRFQLATVPGQTAFNETRRVVLKGTDGIVFVADSQWTMLPKNLENWQNLKENLKANGVSFEGIPVVVQYNKRDLTDILSVEAMQEALGLSSYPFVEAVASAGRGVTETFKLISKLTFVDLLRRLQGRRPEEAPPPPRKEKEDMLSSKESLSNRPAVAQPARPPLSVVPSLPDESPFETEEPPSADAARTELSEEPFAGLPADAPSTAPRQAEESAHARGERAEPEPREFAFDPDADSEAPELLSEVEPVEALGEALDAETAPEEWPSAATAAPASAAPETSLVAEAFDERFRESQLPPGEAASTPAPPDPDRRELQSLVEALESRLTRREESEAGVAAKVRALEELLETLHPRVEAHEERAGAFDRRFDGQEQRFGSIEQRLETLERRVESSEPRFEAHEQRVGAHEERVDSHERRLQSHEQRVEAHDRWVETADRRQRATEDDIAMALQSVSERGERLNDQIAGVLAHLEALQASLEEKNSRSQREAEDIRTQMAPLLEAHGQRDADQERLLSELDRLRESFADSLAELSDRLRRAVRGI